MTKYLKWLGGGFLTLIVLGAIIEATKTPEQKAAEHAARESEQAAANKSKAEQAEAQKQQKLAAIPAVTAREIAVAYDENTVAADKQFKGKEFKVSGTVVDINTDLFGNPYVTLRGGVNEFMEPQFAFDKDDSEQLAKLKKGSRVTMICTGNGDIAKTPMSDTCTII